MTKSLSFKKTSLAIALALSLPLISAQAAESYKAQDVVVTASRVEQQLADVNMSVSVITSEDIAELSGAKTIADLLESKVPGIQVKNDGGQGIDRIKIRGEDAFRTLVMIDGQRISEQKSMSGVPLLIDPSQVERIEVIRGPASVLYGSDAIGGAINIITKKGGKDAFGATVSAGLDTASSGKELSGSIYGAANGWKYRLGGAIRNADNIDTPVGEMPHTEFSSKAANAFLSYDIDPNKTIGLSLSHFDLDFMSGAISYEPEDFFVDVPEWQRTRGSIFGEFKNLTENLARLRIDASYEKNHKLMENFVQQKGIYTPFGTTSMLMDNFADNDLYTTSVSIQSDWIVGDNHYLITGYEFSYDDLEAGSQTFGHTPSMSFMPGVGPVMGTAPYEKAQNFNGSQTRHSLFASMESTVLNDLVFNYGVRYTWVDSDMDINTTHSLNTDFEVGKTSYDTSDGKAIFNFGATYKGFNNLSLRANWSQGYRTPLLQELFIDTSMGGELTYANPDLKPETSDNFEIGARYTNGVLTLDGSVFYSKADDYITTIAVGDGINRYTNMGEAETLGLELDASVKVGDFEPYTVLTLMRREYKENGIKTTKSGTPKVMARYGVRYQNEYDSALFRFDAYAVSQTKTESWNFEKDQLNEDGSFGGFTTFNLTGGVSFGPQKAYSVDVGLYNLTNKLYQTSDAIYEPGRYFALKMNATF
ncbi:MAG TPA: TonB-dependent receptor [Candidatus Aphodousia faecavium]|nr:TonB-dependent receptor [Candidatus Aphodousia faecavium]